MFTNTGQTIGKSLLTQASVLRRMDSYESEIIELSVVSV
jgi:hypothetical protein